MYIQSSNSHIRSLSTHYAASAEKQISSKAAAASIFLCLNVCKLQSWSEGTDRCRQSTM